MKLILCGLLLLNVFFLSISFLIFKYFLLRGCIAVTDFLAFNLDYDTSKIAVEITLKNTYTPYPEGQYKIFLSKIGFKEQLRFLTLNLYPSYLTDSYPIGLFPIHRLPIAHYPIIYFPIDIIRYLQLLCIFTDYLPFIDITLIVYK